MKKALVLGAGGFIGGHLVTRLKRDGFLVLGVDIKKPSYSKSKADTYLLGDLRDPRFCKSIFTEPFDEVYQLAADMGGAGFTFTGDHDADIMHNSSLINLNTLHFGRLSNIKKIFFSSSACIYPERNQTDPDHPNCEESTAYPADPDSEYGWEKLFAERLFGAYNRNYRLNVRIARFHNVYGPENSWDNGREKSVAAICRKVAQAENGGTIELWGDGLQTRSYLYIDQCMSGVRRLMDSNVTDPINIGSEEMISINDLAAMVMTIAGKSLKIKHIKGPMGVRGRSSDNRLIQKKLGWKPVGTLRDGLTKTYAWIEREVRLGHVDR